MEEDILKVNVLKQDGKKSKDVIDFSKFDEVDINDHLIYLAVKLFLNNQRQGTHKSKERSEIKGSTRKLIRQKGTGGARRGDIKSPLLRGGGRIFGPKPNDYDIKMNKKEKKLALLSALKYRLLEKNLNVVDNFNLSNPKTKDFLKVAHNLQMDANRNLIIVSDVDNKLLLGSRNLKNIAVKNFANVNAYDIVSSSKLYFDEESANNLCKTLLI